MSWLDRPVANFVLNALGALLPVLLVEPGLPSTSLGPLLWLDVVALCLPSTIAGAILARRIFGADSGSARRLAVTVRCVSATTLVWVATVGGLFVPAAQPVIWLRPTQFLEEQGRVAAALIAATPCAVVMAAIAAGVELWTLGQIAAWIPRRHRWRWVGCANACWVLGSVAVLGLAMDASVDDWLSRREKPRMQACLSNMKQLGAGLMMYSQDWDDRWPPTFQMPRSLSPYLRQPDPWLCPRSREQYGWNEALSATLVGAVPDKRGTWTFRDTVAHRLTRSERRVVTGFADGHARSVKQSP